MRAGAVFVSRPSIRLGLLGAVLAISAEPAAAQQLRSFNIPSQPLASGIIQFSKQSDIDVIAPAALLRGLHGRRVRGHLTPDQALSRLLEGTGLRGVRMDARSYRLAHRGANPVQAESESGTGAEVPGEELSEQHEIIVTARKRPEPAQEVPAGISVLGERTLERMGADDLDAIARSVPGLNLAQINAIQWSVNIRGISTSSQEVSAQSTVAFYIDDLPTLDVFLSRATPDLRLVDVERVEVLRGPQGTLFGSGSLAGAIRIITNKPDLSSSEFSAEAGLLQVGGGNSGHALSAIGNLPIVNDRLAVRLVGYVRNDPGYIDNVTTGEEDQNQAKVWGGRFMARARPTDNLLLTGTITHQDTSASNSPFSFYDPVDGGPYQWANFGPEEGDVEITSYNLVGEYDAGPATITSSTTWADTEVSISGDFGSRIFSRSLGLPQVRPFPIVNFNRTGTFAQELRIASSADRRLDYVFGAFYAARKYDGGQNILSPVPGNIFSADIGYQANERALFGELILGLTEQIDLTLGGRLFWNSYDISIESSGTLTGLPEDEVVVSSRAGKDSGLNPKAVLSYRRGGNLLVYAMAARGYRTGFINPAVGNLPLTPYDPDTLWNYELGLKSQLLGRRLLLNVAAYYLDWNDVQIDAARMIGDIEFIGIANAGAAWAKGIEVETLFRPAPAWEIASAFSISDTRLTRINPEFTVHALEGSELPAAPNFTLSSSAQYSFGWRNWRNFLRLEHQYVGRSLSGFPLPTSSDRSPPVRIGDYHLLNLRAGLARADLELAGYVRNLLNSRGVVRANASANLNPADAVRVRPTTVGLDLRLRF
jgi:iron complex outermembrane recepter protein